MTKKAEAEAKRQAKLAAERQRLYEMTEYERRHEDCAYICGIDEAGRGPFAGPVVAGAVVLDWKNPDKEILYLNDSKKLSEKKREMIYRDILSRATAVGIGIVGAKIIDEINILQATYLAMHRAIQNLTNVSHLVTDDADVHELVRRLTSFETAAQKPAGEGVQNGTAEGAWAGAVSHAGAVKEVQAEAGAVSHADTVKVVQARVLEKTEKQFVLPDYILADAVHIPELSIPQEGIIKGDAKSVSIAAGSIVAKVTRDHIMMEYDKQYPEYGFAKHKGYGTAAHIQAIKEHGMLEFHRRSFIHFS